MIEVLAHGAHVFLAGQSIQVPVEHHQQWTPRSRSRQGRPSSSGRSKSSIGSPMFNDRPLSSGAGGPGPQAGRRSEELQGGLLMAADYVG
ncbi:MAG: hypothetical protein R2755_11610 [Acidimicrobiales bacterium]